MAQGPYLGSSNAIVIGLSSKEIWKRAPMIFSALHSRGRGTQFVRSCCGHVVQPLTQATLPTMPGIHSLAYSFYNTSKYLLLLTRVWNTATTVQLSYTYYGSLPPDTVPSAEKFLGLCRILHASRLPR
ncbi:hypothetical protein GQ43DRAFT_196843 [Delitschia confertaspora ATCC 74209]|uniref:Uncharacterized protein n=1 Tax=Delitschia confertaspora ATCC 74209 TaxID=1513339 RepID=A0A9P4JVV2_9PLEO|nr:hypothetical protein GQ43DRAFT_196843 [Delitschia confertaspora ATCC 74209]